MSRGWNVLVLLLGMLVSISGALASGAQPPSDLGGDCWQGAPETDDPLQWSNPPEMIIDPSANYVATLETSEGTFTIQLLPEAAPIAVNNFVCLALAGYFDETSFHRIIDGFVIQGGDPTGTGSGGPGYRFDDEPVEGEYTFGTVAMANAGPNTNGSQFFIVLADLQGRLPKDYTIFGQVAEGQDVVRAIGQTPTITNERGEKSVPESPVTLVSVTISGETLASPVDPIDATATAAVGIEQTAIASLQMTETAVVEEQTATAAAQATETALALDQLWTQYFNEIGEWLAQSPELPPGIEIGESEPATSESFVPTEWLRGSTYRAAILGDSDSAWVSLFDFGTVEDAANAFLSVTDGLARSGWTKSDDPDGLESESACLTLVHQATSRSVCYALRGDNLIESHSFVGTEAPEATMMNAVDLAHLADQAISRVESLE